MEKFSFPDLSILYMLDYSAKSGYIIGRSYSDAVCFPQEGHDYLGDSIKRFLAGD